ncbi:MAG TPA: sigma-54 dependent transcriptional regulator, partial [Candidatus Ozemobacteraceae bacterium]|nr:sigma-54 dependent transcriptional regulator [Candidatus Ozemobacteraceae bacterium]
ELPVIICTAYGSIPSAVEAVREGAVDYLAKPLPHVDDLTRSVQRAIEQRDLRRQNRTLLQQTRDPDPFPAQDPLMVGILEKARRAAASDVSILITGESGTGKERLARFIHQQSRRSERPLVAVNCAAIVDTLLESELFGHEKGAFTGATERRSGRFEEAHLGTLFLDEIGELDLALQPKLLRALQEREIRRVGGDRLIRVDTRLITATNRDLREQVKSGTFREDLYYRLSVLVLRIPPLRERREDILYLADRFLRERRQQFARPELKLSPRALDRLSRHAWPGNVRELSNVIEASTLLCEGNLIDEQDLFGLEGDGAELTSSVPDVTSLSPIEAAERQTIVRALEASRGNRAQTAQLLGMSTRNLLYKLKKYDLGGGNRRSRS